MGGTVLHISPCDMRRFVVRSFTLILAHYPLFWTCFQQYQVIRGNQLNQAAGLEGRALSVQSNFMELKQFADNSFDGVYAIEATCHAPQREGVYSQIYRVLKPGQVFACYEWCLTPKYDKNNELHRTIKKKIEEGDGLPDMATQQECVDALTSVGFEVLFILPHTWLLALIYCVAAACVRG